MGEVYLAEDTRLGRKVALKLLPAKLTTEAQSVLRFRQEARAASSLNHPNILTIFDIGEIDSNQFIVAEYIKGETLRKHMLNAKLELLDILDISIQVASALAAAHEARIVHRDIKPENIMIRADGYVKVLDFGLAKLIERQMQTNESETALTPLIDTEVGVVMGTPKYMSPEQVRGLELDGRSDIFSLGTVIYEMVTDESPFAAATTGDIIAAILEKEPPNLALYSPEAPEQLQWIVTQALKKDREERYSATDLLLADLKSLKRKLERDADLFKSTLRMSSNEPPATMETRERVAIETPKEVFATSKPTPANPTSSLEPLLSRIKRYKLITTLILTAIIIAAIVLAVSRKGTARMPISESLAKNGKQQLPAPQKLYSEMTEDERKDFVGQQSQRISAMLGERPAALSDKAVNYIKEDVDSYAERMNSLSEKIWEEGLRMLFGRASQYAPVIIRSFNERGVPPIIGLYLPMIETEYRACLESPVGSKGLFLFMPETARSYGINSKDLCNIEKIAPAAAQYIADRISEFGSDSMSMTLVILSFNRGSDSIRRDLRNLRRDNPNLERSFWTLFDNANKLDTYFQEEGVEYVPRFFAAAIVGENPQAFNLQMPPLSMHAAPANK
jgi:serine/threonine protein kinase